jgi:hypothetical protein
LCLQHFDTDDSGFITREELEVALREHASDAGQLEGDIDAVLAQVKTVCQPVVLLLLLHSCHPACAGSGSQCTAVAQLAAGCLLVLHSFALQHCWAHGQQPFEV